MLRNQIIEERTKIFLEVIKEFPEFAYVGDPILRAKTTKVDVAEGIDIGHKLGDILVRYRAISGIGRGLAGPQIGISKSVFVTYLDDNIDIYLNPRIVRLSETNNLFRELCLSSGTMAAEVSRAEWILMQWTDVKGNLREEKFDGFLARLYQHEEEHLRGVLNLDHPVMGGIEFATFDPTQEILRPK